MNILKNTFRFWLALAAAALASMTFSGCVAVVAGAAGAGTVAYVRGELDAALPASYDRAVSATDRAIQQLEFAKISESKDALTANFVVRTADDKKVAIRVLKVTDRSSKVEIRVGFFGDKNLSLTILDKIRGNL